jgi:hypothetical protein
MYRSKVRATPEEIEAIRLAMTTPMIMTHIIKPVSPLERCHKLALSHGLPEQRGHYGLDSETGEFLSQYPIEEPEEES